ncbi:MAG: hypothetical protein N3B18_13865, partial [Desulfobacterota bacterium]|nr:hypothetical protein [Thermodesulfobacteriota bacterium]
MKVRLLELLVCPSCHGSLHLNVLRSNVCDRTSLITIQPCTTCHFRDITGKDSDCNYCVQYEIEEALLTCQCGRMFPVVDTVPVMITDAHQAFLRLLHKYPHLSIPSANLSTKKCHAESATQRRFAFEWKRYPEYLEEEERHVFLEETQIKPELFQNRLTLDAGCGMG